MTFNSDISNIELVKKDLIDGARRWETWVALAWGELSSRYGRTVFGVAWNIISFLVFCLAIIFVFGALTENDDFGPHVIIGLLIFVYISSLITSACSVFTASENWLKSAKLPYSLFVFKGVMVNTYIFLFNSFVSLLILFFFYDISLNVNQIFIFPAIIVVLVNAVAVYMLFGVLCVRYRDLTHLVNTVMRFSLFLTPIMWKAEDLGVRGIIALYNPLTHFIEIFRYPIIYGNNNNISWIIVLGCTALLSIFALLTFTLTRKKLIFWL